MTEEETEVKPIEVKVIQPPPDIEGDFDYDDFMPTDKEIEETEIDMEKIQQKKKVTT